ncbi:uncharacterized protein [Magallana gigas]|uniref:uncharacterized protein n=1 Tax=Magallana gigas TaxID=29159 RepID=UPI00333E8067
MSRLVFSSLSTLVPVGSGICRKCIDLVHNLPDNHEDPLNQTDIKNDNDNEKNISAEITQRCAAYSLRPINIENGGDCIEHSDQLSSQESQHLSQTSNWSEENSLGLETLNSIVHTISNGKLSPLKYQLQKPLQDITSQSRNYIQKKASQMVHSILELVAPGQSEDLLKLMVEPVTNTNHQETENLLEILTKIYNDSTYKAVKDQTLSIMGWTYNKRGPQEQNPRTYKLSY